tara:strand:+ start:347 stop:517 length:171 start_codon:yes stop_codon:yes gene_type:complete
MSNDDKPWDWSPATYRMIEEMVYMLRNNEFEEDVLVNVYETLIWKSKPIEWESKNG